MVVYTVSGESYPLFEQPGPDVPSEMFLENNFVKDSPEELPAGKPATLN